ncbi:SGNH/GDSL hydrolase family protein [uncultured Tateyamaria sp.]|uniref:SGNH/GDSL hydrolase family protein n=1 Tax=uncultured Tateyamaria sp. TaxID=455651 RepID=UPI002621B9E0|nr:SGNH/GDSL hydrolase family protein [uncultured Tateyamaria sp.]
MPRFRSRVWGVAAGACAVVATLVVFLRPQPSQINDVAIVPLPSGPVHIVAFGTSLTARSPWPDNLQTVLSTCRDAPVQVTRIAAPGAGSAWGQSLVSDVIAAQPDVVLLEFAINDADILDGVPLSRARTQHDTILSGLGAALPEARIALMTMNPAFGLRGVVRPFLNAHYQQYQALAVDHQIGLVDLYSRWRMAPREIGRPADGLHPSPDQEAHIIIPTLAAALGCDAG